MERPRSRQFADVADITEDADIVTRYRKAVAKGMLKVIRKMGISTRSPIKAHKFSKPLGWPRIW